MTQVHLVLESQALQPLQLVKVEQNPNITILEADGVFVLGRAENQDEKGCPGREIKMALVHTSGTSSNRFMVADHSEIIRGYRKLG